MPTCKHRSSTSTARTVHESHAMIAVKWDVPCSRFDGVVHYVPSSLADNLGGGRVAVWWPSRKRGKRWEGNVVQPDKLDAGNGRYLQTMYVALVAERALLGSDNINMCLLCCSVLYAHAMCASAGRACCSMRTCMLTPSIFCFQRLPYT